MEAELRELTSILGSENIFTDSAALVTYAVRTGAPPENTPMPLAIVRPTHTNQLQRLLKFCSGANIRLAIRGAGTSFCSHTGESSCIVLVTTGLNRILEIDTENRVAICQPGVTNSALRLAAAQKKLYYPPNPASGIVSTIGGNIAMNAAGSTTIKYGPTANYVNSLEVYLTNGEKLKCASQNGFLFAGFPIAQLFAGSAGCLGIIGVSYLRLLPSPEVAEETVFCFPDEILAAQAASAIIASPLSPSGLEFLDAYCAMLLAGEKTGPMLALAFDGSSETVKTSLEEAGRIAAQYSGTRKEFQPDMAVLTPTLAARGPFVPRTLVCPPAHSSRLLEGLRTIANDHEISVVVFGHIGVARLYAILSGKRADISAAQKDMFTLELMLNNAMQNESDSELSRDSWLAAQTGISLANGLRKLFDPAGLLAAPLPGTSGV